MSDTLKSWSIEKVTRLISGLLKKKEITDTKNAVDSICDVEIAQLNGDHYITTSGSTANINDPESASDWACAVMPCQPGDVFTVTGAGGTKPRLWAFVDANTPANVLSKANAGVVSDNLEIEAPANAAYVVFNTRTNTETKPAFYNGTPISTSIDKKANIASPTFTGTPKAPTAPAGTNNTQIATTAFVNQAFQINDAMVFKGTIGTGGTVTELPATHYQGWTYKVVTAGIYAGEMCEIGDMIICVTDGTVASDGDWTVVQSNVDGAVTGPRYSEDYSLAAFNGTSGKVIRNTDIKTDINGSLIRGAKAGTTVGTGGFAFGRDVEARGDYSHAEGEYTSAIATGSHVEGRYSQARGIASHAEGLYSTAIAGTSHAEGDHSTAMGEASHAEGKSSSAFGNYAHSEGAYTGANGRSQHVFGEYNVIDNVPGPTQRGTYVEIVGNGTDTDNKSNARTLDWDGNEELAGDLTINKGSAYEVKVGEVIASKEDALYKVADTPASIVTIDDGADDMPVKEMEIAIEPVQDLNGYDRPWPAGGGKNLLDDSTNVHKMAINASGEMVSNANGNYSQLIPVTAGETYTFSAISKQNTWTRRVHGYTGETWVEQLGATANSVPSGQKYAITATIPNGIDAIRISYCELDEEAQFELGSEATDYAPFTNICPITGRTGCEISKSGKNLYNPIRISGSGNSGTAVAYVKCKPGDKFVIKRFGEAISSSLLNGDCSYGWCDAKKTRNRIGAAKYWQNNDYMNEVTVIMPEGAEYLYVGAYASKGLQDYVLNNAVQLVIQKDTVPTEFIPFIGATYPIAFPSSAGTVYGGNLTIHSDGTGELVVDRAFFEIDGSGTGYGVGGNTYKYVRYTPESSIYYYGTPTDGISNMFTEQAIGNTNADIGFGFANGRDIRIRYGLFTELTIAEAKEWLAEHPVQVCYKIASPMLYQLTAPQVRTLLGFNHIWADTGNINELTYTADGALANEFKRVDAKIADKADSIYKTIDTHADVVTIENCADDLPVREMRIAIEPVQDLNGQDSPYPAGGGKNLLSGLEVGGIDVETGENIVNDTVRRTIDYIPVDVSRNYTISGFTDTGNNKVRVFYYSSNKTYLNSEMLNLSNKTATFSLYSDASYIRLQWNYLNAEVTDKVQIEVGSEATSYAPYSNICPISGRTWCNVQRTGKNLFVFSEWQTVFDYKLQRKDFAQNGYTITYPANKSIGNDYPALRVILPCKHLIGEKVIFHVKINDPNKFGSANFRVGEKNEDSSSTATANWFGQQATTAHDPNKENEEAVFSAIITMPYLLVAMSPKGDNTTKTTAYPITWDIQMEIGDTATEMVSPQTVNYPITFPSEAGTVYGGNLTIHADGTGELVVNRATHEFTGTENILLNASAGKFKLVNNFGWMRDSNDGQGLSNMLKWAISGDYFFALSDQIYFGWAECETVASFKSKLAELYNAGTPLVISYRLATAISYQLTAPQVRTLLGTNNIWSNTGVIKQLTYPVDGNIAPEIKLALNSVDKTNRMISSIESAVATENHKIGDTFICNGKLYKATTAIEIGDALVEDVNITEVTITDELSDIRNDNGNARIFSCVCDTAGGYAIKRVDCEECDELREGDIFIIEFLAAQTYNGAATLQINDFGAKNIRRIHGTNISRYEWSAGETLTFRYNGTHFIISNAGLATTTYYGRTKLYTGAASTSTALALTPASLNSFANGTACPYYSASKTYEVGDKVRYGNYIYQCVNAIPTAQSWTAANWEVGPTLQEQVSGKLDKNQGSANADKFMKVGSDGNIVLISLNDLAQMLMEEISVWEGGSY